MLFHTWVWAGGLEAPGLRQGLRPGFLRHHGQDLQGEDPQRHSRQPGEDEFRYHPGRVKVLVLW